MASRKDSLDKHETSMPQNTVPRKGATSELYDSRQVNRSGSVLARNHEEMFYKFDRHGTTPRSLAIIYGTPERTVCEILRTTYHQRIERARRAS